MGDPGPKPFALAGPTVGAPLFSGDAAVAAAEGTVPFTLGTVALPFDSLPGGPEPELLLLFGVVGGGALLKLLVLFGGGCGSAPLLLDSGLGGAPLVARLVLLVVVVAPLETVTGGYGRLGGGRAAGAGDGAGAAVGGIATGLALPARPSGPLLSGGRPVVGKSNFRGADGPVGTAEVVVLVVMP